MGTPIRLPAADREDALTQASASAGAVPRPPMSSVVHVRPSRELKATASSAA